MSAKVAKNIHFENVLIEKKKNNIYIFTKKTFVIKCLKHDLQSGSEGIQ